ncbi:MAG: hypothetical protein LBL80_05900 [Ruminococcus sp.]|nr:hypothetical protein [Ruminococcus sp.]
MNKKFAKIADTVRWFKMSSYEDDRPRATPDYLKGLTTEQLRERAEKLFQEIEKKKSEGKLRIVNT